MTPEPPGDGAADDRPPSSTPASWPLRLGALLLAALLAGSLVLLASGPGVLAPAALGLASVAVGVVPRGAWARVPRLDPPPTGGLLFAGAGLLAVATVGVPIPRYVSLPGLLFLLAFGVPFLLLVLIVGRIDPEAAPRPRLPRRALVRRVGLLLGLALVLVLAPTLFAPVQFLWTTDLAPTASVLVLAGASVAVFVPSLVERDREPFRLEAGSLDPDRGTTVFEVLRRRSGRG